MALDLQGELLCRIVSVYHALFWQEAQLGHELALAQLQFLNLGAARLADLFQPVALAPRALQKGRRVYSFRDFLKF